MQVSIRQSLFHLGHLLSKVHVPKHARALASATLPHLPKISVVGVGGAGGNCLNNLAAQDIGGVHLVAANTDHQALNFIDKRAKTIQLGRLTTRGLGAGARPEIGAKSAEESMDELLEVIGDSNMVFVTAGMGGGTGTGAAPIIAKKCREQGILTVGVVSRPFRFEGLRRSTVANKGVSMMTGACDTLIVVPNDTLLSQASASRIHPSLTHSFKLADEVLASGVRNISDLVIKPGLVNLDFADVKSIMESGACSLMGTGSGVGGYRAQDAVKRALSNPLLEVSDVRGATGVLISIAGGSDLSLFDVSEITNCVREVVDPNANIIFGSTIDENLKGEVRVSVVVTGLPSATNRVLPLTLNQEQFPSAAPASPEDEPSPSTPQMHTIENRLEERRRWTFSDFFKRHW